MAPYSTKTEQPHARVHAHTHTLENTRHSQNTKGGREQFHTFTQVRTQRCTHTSVDLPVHTHARSHTHSSIRTHKQSVQRYTYVTHTHSKTTNSNRTQTHLHTRTHTRAHIFVCIHTRSRTHTAAHIAAHAHTSKACIDADTHSRVHVFM